MAKISIVPDDITVGIDSDFEVVPFQGNPNIHAVHWDDVAEIGEEEYKNGPNKTITNFAPYQRYVTDHGNSKAAREAAEAAEEQQVIDDQDAENAQREADQEASKTQQDKRNEAYPQVADQLAALHYDRGGDPAPLAAIDAAMDIVDAAIPL